MTVLHFTHADVLGVASVHLVAVHKPQDGHIIHRLKLCNFASAHVFSCYPFHFDHSFLPLQLEMNLVPLGAVSIIACTLSAVKGGFTDQ